uniref:V-SNARE coiled-coil homology domain-containing protein n=1 Tax=Ascaris lumbricoides TaxID=6252 RepID=A0A0M3HRC7_ASCLU
MTFADGAEQGGCTLKTDVTTAATSQRCQNDLYGAVEKLPLLSASVTSKMPSIILQVMNSNVQRILERGDRLENLEGRTEALTQSSENFKISARRVQRHMCRRNAKWTIIVIVGSVVVVTIIVLIILNSAGVFDHK